MAKTACRDCGKMVEAESIKAESCPECFEGFKEFCIRCEGCGDLVHEDDTKEVNEKLLCELCYDLAGDKNV